MDLKQEVSAAPLVAIVVAPMRLPELSVGSVADSDVSQREACLVVRDVARIHAGQLLLPVKQECTKDQQWCENFTQSVVCAYALLDRP